MFSHIFHIVWVVWLSRVIWGNILGTTARVPPKGAQIFPLTIGSHVEWFSDLRAPREQAERHLFGMGPRLFCWPQIFSLGSFFKCLDWSDLENLRYKKRAEIHWSRMKQNETENTFKDVHVKSRHGHRWGMVAWPEKLSPLWQGVEWTPWHQMHVRTSLNSKGMRLRIWFRGELQKKRTSFSQI